MRDIHKKLILTALFISAIFAPLAFFYTEVKEDTISRVDYITFVTAAEIVKSGEGKNLYSIPLQHAVQQNLIEKYYKTDGTLLFMNIPPVSVLYLLASTLSLLWGYRLVVVFELILLVYFLWLFYKGGLKKSGKFQFFALVTLFNIPVYYSLFNAQIVPILIFGIIIGAYLCMSGNKHFLAGLFLGLLAIKFQYLTVVPFLFLLSKNKKDFLKGFLLSFVLVLASSVILVGLNSFWHYFGFLISTDSLAYSVDPRDIFSLHSLLKIIPIGNNINTFDYLLIDILLYVVVFLVYLIGFRRVNFKRSFAIAVMLAVPLSVHVFAQDLVILLIPLFLFYVEYIIDRPNRYLLFIAIALYFVPFAATLGLNPQASLLMIVLGSVMLLIDRQKETVLIIADKKIHD